MKIACDNFVTDTKQILIVTDHVDADYGRKIGRSSLLSKTAAEAATREVAFRSINCLKVRARRLYKVKFWDLADRFITSLWSKFENNLIANKVKDVCIFIGYSM